LPPGGLKVDENLFDRLANPPASIVRMHEWMSRHPEHLHTDQLEFFAATNWAMTGGLLAHVAFLACFALLGLDGLALFNVGSITVFSLCVAMARRGIIAPTLFLATIEVCAHAAFATITLGWSSAFHYYVTILVVLYLLNGELSFRIRIGIATLLSGGYGLLALSMVHRQPTATVDPWLASAFTALNVFVFLAILCGICFYYAWAVRMVRQDRVRAKSELATALAQSQAVVRTMADGLLALGPDGEVLHINPSLIRMLDLQLEPTRADLPPELISLAEQALNDHSSVERDIHFPGDRVGGAVATAIHGPSKQDRLGAVVLIRDVTAAKALDRMKTEFTATVSHELRTPLTSVMGFAKLIKRQLDRRILPNTNADDPKVAAAIDTVQSNLDILMAEGERLTELVNDVLDIAKMESGSMKWEHGPIDPSALVNRTHQASLGLFAASDVALRIEVGDDLPTLIGDANRLQQVLTNLVSNAAKFTVSGEVVIAVRKRGDGVEFEVRDTGPGIAAMDLETIFEKFKQVGDLLTDKPTGTGLGLAISKQIVEAHGGQIRAKSTLGEGSRFSFQMTPEKVG